MLKVLSIADVGPETVKTDSYSFTIHWPGSLGYPCYWRAGFASHSFLQIGIHYRSGRLISIQLLTARQVRDWPNNRVSASTESFPEESGVPVFHVEEAWISEPDAMYVDSTDDVVVYVGERRVALDLGKWDRVATYIRSGRVRFGVDRDRLLNTIEVENLTEKEMTDLINQVTRY